VPIGSCVDSGSSGDCGADCCAGARERERRYTHLLVDRLRRQPHGDDVVIVPPALVIHAVAAAGLTDFQPEQLPPEVVVRTGPQAALADEV
jgi:hypothetical protein